MQELTSIFLQSSPSLVKLWNNLLSAFSPSLDLTLSKGQYLRTSLEIGHSFLLSLKGQGSFLFITGLPLFCLLLIKKSSDVPVHFITFTLQETDHPWGISVVFGLAAAVAASAFFPLWETKDTLLPDTVAQLNAPDAYCKHGKEQGPAK